MGLFLIKIFIFSSPKGICERASANMSNPDHSMKNNAKKLNVAVFISGRGSNLQSLIDACEAPDFPAEIAVVVSNKADAYGLVRAQNAGIPALAIPHKDYATREAFEQAILDGLKDYDIGLICHAGFMRILTPYFLNHWHGPIINIHPALLPKFKGLHTHERALEAGESISGCTVHYVSEGVDEGEIILQKTVPILPGDTAETLAARVLEQEHIAYPEAVRLLAENWRGEIINKR